MKKGKLSKAEIQIIENGKHRTIKDLAKELDRSEDIVKKQYEIFFPPENPAANEQPEKEDTHIMNMMAKNKKFGVVIMTENASMASDEVIKNRIKNTQNKPGRNDCIHKFK